MERLPGRGSCCVELERIQVWVECDVVSCARYFGPVCDAVSQGFPVIGYAYEGSLGACEAEALILEFAALLVDACECSVATLSTAPRCKRMLKVVCPAPANLVRAAKLQKTTRNGG